MIFVVLLAFAAKKFFHDFLFGCVKACLQQCGFFRDEDVEGKDVEENIGSFWESLTGDDQKIWYANEVYRPQPIWNIQRERRGTGETAQDR